METRTCRVCSEPKDVTEFSLRKENGKRRTECASCRSLASTVARYGITVERYRELLEQQGHRCAICGVHEEDVEHASFRHQPLVVDHDHRSGRVRGLLCARCNVALGHFDDSPSKLTKAIEYLEWQHS